MQRRLAGVNARSVEHLVANNQASRVDRDDLDEGFGTADDDGGVGASVGDLLVGVSFPALMPTPILRFLVPTTHQSLLLPVSAGTAVAGHKTGTRHRFVRGGALDDAAARDGYVIAEGVVTDAWRMSRRSRCRA